MVDVVKVFGFEVMVAASAEVEARDGVEARSLLERSLEGATALVRTGPGSWLELAGLRCSGTPRLATIDGEDPVAALEAALRRFRENGG